MFMYPIHISVAEKMADPEDSSSGDSTDVYSEKFDPLKALYSDKARIPVPEAPVFDNISKFESAVLKGVVIKTNDGEKSKKEGESSSTRRFLPHQEPIKTGDSERQQRYADKNVISRMGKLRGPLAALYQYMEGRTRVRVYTRDASGVRGHLEAYVAAFDRHWNLALEDCLEVWRRKVKRKTPALGCLKSEAVSGSDTGPKVVVKERKGKMETLERHVPQLLVRGEQVVLVIKMD